MKSHEHKYIVGTIGDECDFCGLLKSTIESMSRKKCGCDGNDLDQFGKYSHKECEHINLIAEIGNTRLCRDCGKRIREKCDCKNKGFDKCVNEEVFCEHYNDLGDMGFCDICSDKVWKDAVNEPILNAIKEFKKGGWHITDINKCNKFIEQVKKQMDIKSETTEGFKDDYNSNYPPRKHKIKILYTVEHFEQFMYENESNINVHNVHIGSCTPNSTFQEGFIGIIYYSPITK